jgi:hypothetical protein
VRRLSIRWTSITGCEKIRNWLTVVTGISGPLPLWSSCQRSWLQIQRSWFDCRRYQISWEVVDLERGPLSLVSTIEELLERKSIGSGLETDITTVGIRHADHETSLYHQKLALTSPTSGGHSIDIVRSLTQATEFVLFVWQEFLLLALLSV